MESSGTTWAVWAVIIIVLLGGVYWYWSANGSPSMYGQNASGTSTTTSTSDTSDNGIGEDTAAIDVQIQALTTDSANVDSSMNDQSVQ